MLSSRLWLLAVYICVFALRSATAASLKEMPHWQGVLSNESELRPPQVVKLSPEYSSSFSPVLPGSGSFTDINSQDLHTKHGDYFSNAMRWDTLWDHEGNERYWNRAFYETAGREEDTAPEAEHFIEMQTAIWLFHNYELQKEDLEEIPDGQQLSHLFRIKLLLNENRNMAMVAKGLNKNKSAHTTAVLSCVAEHWVTDRESLSTKCRSVVSESERKRISKYAKWGCPGALELAEALDYYFIMNGLNAKRPYLSLGETQKIMCDILTVMEDGDPDSGVQQNSDERVNDTSSPAH